MPNPELIDQLKSAAITALTNDKWILCATLCRAIEEINIDSLVNEGGAGALNALREALGERTTLVPLVGHTRAETPSAGKRYCLTCGGAYATFTDRIDITRAPGAVPQYVDGLKFDSHIDEHGRATGADHLVSK